MNGVRCEKGGREGTWTIVKRRGDEAADEQSLTIAVHAQHNSRYNPPPPHTLTTIYVQHIVSIHITAREI